MSVTREKLHALTQAIPYKTRTGHRGAQLAYIDARDAMDLLDEVVGPENWQCDYKQVKNVVYCGIGINTQEAGWVWKWDAGDESNIEEEKGEASDSFKRAAVRWGIGRFLYRLGSNPKPAQTQQQYKKPTQTQQPAQFKKKEDTASVIPMTQEQAIKITGLCKKANIDNMTFAKTIQKKFNHGWKHLSQAEANQLIAELENFGGAA